MKSSYKNTIIIELNETEAKWLSNVIQNPLYGETPDEERPQNKEMRRLLWDALNFQSNKNQ